MSKLEQLPPEIVAVVIGEFEVVRPPLGTPENSAAINSQLLLDFRQTNEAIKKKKKKHNFLNKMLLDLL